MYLLKTQIRDQQDQNAAKISILNFYCHLPYTLADWICLRCLFCLLKTYDGQYGYFEFRTSLKEQH